MKLTLLLLIVTLASASCGSNDSATDVSTTTTAPSATTSAPSLTSDEMIAGQVTLTQEDLDESWTSRTPRPENAGVTAGDKGLATCLGRPDPRLDQTANVQGYAFVRVNDAITSSVQLLRSTTDASANVDALRSTQMVECLKPLAEADIHEQFGHLLGSGATFQTSIAPITEIPTDDKVFAWRVTIDMTIGGQTTRLFGDLVGFQHDRLVGTMYFSFAETPPASDLQNELLSSMQQRAHAAIAKK